MAEPVKRNSAQGRRQRATARQPVIGWVMISREEVAKAEALLHGGEKGVVDELGLLSIHQAIADRLFPGTSVLHTRLRYAMFVPWLMQAAAASKHPIEKLASLEFDLTGQLLAGVALSGEDKRGIIGARVHGEGKHAAQPPSYSYWSALSAWGILGRDYMRAQPSREAVLEELASASRTTAALGTDGQPVTSGAPLFEGLPSPPAGFLAEPKLATFRLRPGEKSYLVRRLAAVKTTSPDAGTRESLLASLASRPVHVNPSAFFWDDEAVRDRASSADKPVLDIARDVSALGGIARAIYLALVEQAADDKGFTAPRTHRDHLKACRDWWAADAARADLDALSSFGLGLHSGSKLHDLLNATQHWVRSSARTPGASLGKHYSLVESSRKHSRARLSGLHGATSQLRRWAKFADRSATADRLHFRWPQIRSLIRDLHE